MTQRKLLPAIATALLVLTSMLLQAQGWEKTYPNSSQTLSSKDVLITADGNYIGLAGNFSGPAQVVKTDPLGNAIWNKEYGLNGLVFYMNSIINTNDGGYAMTGTYHFSSTLNGMALYKLNSQGDSLWMKDFGCCGDWASDLFQTDDGGFLITGNRPIPPIYDTMYATVIRTDSNGAVLWNKTYFKMTQPIAPDLEGYRRVVQRSNGNFLMVGSGDGQVRVTEIDGNGDIVWERLLENPDSLHLVCSDVEETLDGGLLIGGGHISTVTDDVNGSNMWKLDANGNLLWSSSNDQLHDFVNSLSENALGEVYVGHNSFIQKIAPDGSILCSLNENGSRKWLNVEVEATSDGGAIAAVTLQAGNTSNSFYLSLVKLDAACLAAVDLIAGNVNVDADADCINNGAGNPLPYWLVELNDGQFSRYQLTDSLGNYAFNVGPGNFELTLHPPMSYWESCDQNLSVTVGSSPDTVLQDLQAIVLENCPYLVIDLASQPMRPCVEKLAAVSYANIGPATAVDAYLQITLDTLLLMDTASAAYTALPGNIYQFDLGDLPSGETGQIWFEVQGDCALQLGNTVCLQANIYPDSLCGDGIWSGATIEVRGDCEGDSARFEIKNVGPAAMAAPLGFIVVEDDVMYMNATFDLDVSESQQVSIPNQNKIYSLIAAQEAGYPFGSFAMDVVGFCQNPLIFTPFSTEYFNQFPYDDGSPTVDIECVLITNSYDPNQMVAKPAGFGPDHRIERKTPIEYHIDFQNTGTDVAFNIVIRDTIPQQFNLASLRPGASSHPYSVQMEDPGVLVFSFPNINLPDSTTNEPASHGFVEFKIDQKLDLAIGTVIENSAAIYFDNNSPINTNSVFHTIGEGFIQVLNDLDETSNLAPLKVFPNPASDAVTFSLPTVLGENASFQLHDQLGNLVRSQPASGDQFRFERKGMASGIYFYSIENEGLKLYSGKVILK